MYYQPYCKECTKKKTVEFQKANPEKRKLYDKKDNDKPSKRALMTKLNKVRRENGELRKWQRNNPEKLKLYQSLHRVHKVSTKEWEDCKNYFNYRCAYCGIKIEEHYIKYKGKLMLGDFHKDHIDHKGANDLSNCIPACKTCNTSKHTANLDDWYNETNKSYSLERLIKIKKWLLEDYKKFFTLKQK